MSDDAPDDGVMGPDSTLAKETWFNNDWRPAMCWLYFVICACDFVLFPIGSMLMPILFKLPYVAWVPITLTNGGALHLALGGITGLYVHNRTREKLAQMDPDNNQRAN